MKVGHARRINGDQRSRSKLVVGRRHGQCFGGYTIVFGTTRRVPLLHGGSGRGGQERRGGEKCVHCSVNGVECWLWDGFMDVIPGHQVALSVFGRRKFAELHTALDLPYHRL